MRSPTQNLRMNTLMEDSLMIKPPFQWAQTSLHHCHCLSLSLCMYINSVMNLWARESTSKLIAIYSLQQAAQFMLARGCFSRDNMYIHFTDRLKLNSCIQKKCSRHFDTKSVKAASGELSRAQGAQIGHHFT